MKSVMFFRHTCFERTSILQIKDSSQQCQVCQRRATYILQESLNEELQRPQKQQIIVPLGIDETSEWCNNFVLVPMVNSKVILCLDPARLDKALTRPIHRGLMLIDTLPRLADMKNLILIDVNSSYHNLN